MSLVCLDHGRINYCFIPFYILIQSHDVMRLRTIPLRSLWTIFVSIFLFSIPSQGLDYAKENLCTLKRVSEVARGALFGSPRVRCKSNRHHLKSIVFRFFTCFGLGLLPL